MREPSNPPEYATDDRDPARLVLRGRWTLKHANTIGEQLRTAPSGITSVDVSAVDRLDSAGVLQLLRFARRPGRDAFSSPAHRCHGYADQVNSLGPHEG